MNSSGNSGEPEAVEAEVDVGEAVMVDVHGRSGLTRKEANVVGETANGLLNACKAGKTDVAKVRRIPRSKLITTSPSTLDAGDTAVDDGEAADADADTAIQLGPSSKMDKDRNATATSISPRPSS